MSKSKQIRNKLEEAGIRYWAGDNISAVLQNGDKEELIDEAALALETVLDTLIIDRFNDLHSPEIERSHYFSYISFHHHYRQIW